MVARATKRSAHAIEVDDGDQSHHTAALNSIHPISASSGGTALANGSTTTAANGCAGPADSGAHTGEEVPVPPRKRKRRVISCAECHRRKQKCDRGLPCRACIDRKLEASCHYETVAMSRERHHTRLVEAAAYGRALQEGGNIQVKTAGFGYAPTTANTLGFLHKIDGGGSAMPTGSDTAAGRSEADGAGVATSMISESPKPGVTAPLSSQPAAVMAEQDYVRQQQRQRQPSSSPPNNPSTREVQQKSYQTIHPQHTTFDHQRLQGPQIGDPYGMGERYRALVRELPPRPVIEHVAGLYFTNFNWNYYAIDRCVFFKQLGDWMDIALGPFGTPQSPVQMSPDLRAFPALLFNVIATGLLIFDIKKKEELELFESIKRPTTKSIDDLALEYSETGMALLSLLGKRQMSYTTVLAGFARSAFLKYVALITEAWHALGMAIRDAQEVGLHRSDMDPKPWAQTAEAVLENAWEIQRRRRLWMTLASWDVQMAVILGRPTTIDLSVRPIKPIDCLLPKTSAERSTMAVQARTENDPPTPLSRVIWAYEANLPLQAILELEKQGPCPRNFSRVDELHEQIVAIEARTPAYFRLENPDTRFDDVPGCDWLRSVRATTPQIPILNPMALHRQYIFTRPTSRTEALKACVRMLQVQRVHFASLQPRQYKTFSLFFGTFDSLVLLAAIYILFPKEHHELLPEAIQHYRWSIERFEIMMEYHVLARSALSVLHANYLRMRKALGTIFLESESGAAAPVDPLTMSQIDPSLKGTRPAAGAGNVSTNVDSTPGEMSNRSATSSAGSEILSSSAATVQGDTPTTDTQRHGSSSTHGLDYTSASPDKQVAGPSHHAPSLSGLDDPLFGQLDDAAANDLLGPECQGTLDSIFPDDFDWTSLPTICPTGDLTYNVLTGVGDKSLTSPAYYVSLEGTAPSSYELDDANNAAARAAVSAAQAATAAEEDAANSSRSREAGESSAIDEAIRAWQFEGDFSSFSVWGLLNQYSPG